MSQQDIPRDWQRSVLLLVADNNPANRRYQGQDLLQYLHSETLDTVDVIPHSLENT
jgi:hypothetical protein